MRPLTYILALVTLLILGSADVRAQYVMEWAQTFGGNGWDEANTCIELRNGDYVIAGFAKLEQKNLWIVKMRNNGEGRWGKVLDEYLSSSANGMIQDSDSNIVVVGHATRKREYQSNLLIMKIDTTGNIIWQKTYGGDGDEEGHAIIECKDGGYAIAGMTSSNADVDPNWYIMKVDHNGNQLWDQQFGSGSPDCALSIAQTYDDGFVVTGYLGTNDGGRKLMSIVKFSADGTDEWSQWYYINDWCAGTSIVATRDSMIVAAGYTKAYTITDFDALLVKTDMNGDTLWTRTFGDEDWQEATGLIEAYDNTFVLSGFTSSNRKDHSSFLMMKFDSRGNLIWNQAFKRKSQDYAKSIVETRDNGILLAGTTFSFGKGWDMAVLKMQPEERTELFFSFPSDSLSTTLRKTLNFEMCLNSFGVPIEVMVSANGRVQIIDNDFQKIAAEDLKGGCDYPLSYTVNLRPGKNIIKVEVVDYKNYTFEKEIEVYRLPGYDFIR